MSKFSSILDAFGDVYWAQKLSPSQQLAISRFRQSADMQALQGAVGNLEAELGAIRQAHLDGLAAQQRIIQQEQLQAHLEEFVYNVEKLVERFGAEDCDVPLSVRYFNLRGIQDAVARQGIGTPVIRGRENKAGFERAMSAVQQMMASLERDSDVKEALAWAEKENQRRQSQVDVRRQQIIARLSELNAAKQPLAFTDWYLSKFGNYLDRKKPFDNLPFLKSLSPSVYKVVASVLLWGPLPFGACYGCVWIPIWFNKTKKKAELYAATTVDAEMSRLQQELSAL